MSFFMYIDLKQGKETSAKRMPSCFSLLKNEYPSITDLDNNFSKISI